MANTPQPPFDKDTWRKLIRPAFRIVDSLETNGYGKLEFRIGGGTVLMFRFDHRISKDIDIFTHDAQALSYISPRLNEVAERESRDYEEQPNAVKLTLPHGSVDFIVAAPVMRDAPCQVKRIEGRDVVLDATAEILAKKLMYRAEGFKARDVFDMATVLALDRPSAIAALQATARTRPVLMARLARMAGAPQADLMAGIVLTDAGRAHAPDMVEKLLTAVAEVDGPGPAPQQPRRRAPARRRGGMGM